MKAKSEGKVMREHEYGRYGNPTQQECERKLAAIEGAERAILFSTGMSAVILTLMAYMRRDGHIIFTSDCYRQTRDFATNLSPSSASRFPWWTRLPRPSQRRSGLTRTSSSLNRRPIPICGCLDIPAMVKVAKQHKVRHDHRCYAGHLYNIRPLDMGVDMVIHSATKYLGGHNDLLAGVALGSDQLMNNVNRMQRMIGATPGPLTCFCWSGD